MRATMLRILGAFLVTALLTGGTTAMAADPTTREQPKAEAPDKDAQGVCDMMSAPGMTSEGQKVMRDFMQSPKGAHAMHNMMEMARRMGNGDPALGMTRMMEMMSGQRRNDGQRARPGRPPAQVTGRITRT